MFFGVLVWALAGPLGGSRRLALATPPLSWLRASGHFRAERWFVAPASGPVHSGAGFSRGHPLFGLHSSGPRFWPGSSSLLLISSSIAWCCSTGAMVLAVWWAEPGVCKIWCLEFCPKSFCPIKPEDCFPFSSSPFNAVLQNSRQAVVYLLLKVASI